MDKIKRAEEIAVQILKYSRNELLVSLRFMDLALCRLKYKMEDISSVATNGEFLYFNPKYVFRLYEAGNSELNHTYLHTIFHCIFYHPFVNATIDAPEMWDLACDIAVEGIIAELNLKQLNSTNSLQIAQELNYLKSKYGKLTAERLYRKFLLSKLSTSEILRLRNIFIFDEHSLWYTKQEETKEGNSGQNDERKKSSGHDSNGFYSDDGDSSIQDEWVKIGERVKVDIETSSKEWGDRSENLLQNIMEVNREKYDYTEFLRKFSVMGEEMQINDDEFDYIFYTYGLHLYKKVPLVEPLEYKDVKKIKEFVIAIDTSGSVQGDLVKKFITKTYNILLRQENFFTKINIHIIQCDAQIQMDDKITSKDEFENLMANMELRGFGGTDFRPVFNYVDALIRQGEFENLKGLIYFTDGYGIFPDKKPVYDSAFVFIDDEYGQPEIPVWAIKLVLATDEI